MKVYIKETEKSLFEQAKSGFLEMGYEVIMYRRLTSKVEDDAIVVGYISDIHNICEIMNLNLPEQIDYPETLKKYLLRDISIVGLFDLPNNYPFFVKPVFIKNFSGRVVRRFSDLIGVKNERLYFTSTIHNIKSEYRCYVLHGELIGMKHYKGDPFICSDKETVESMIADYTDSPSAYSLDVGVTDKGASILIECNHAYSSGNYGLPDIKYANFLKQGFLEIKQINKFLK